MPEIQHTVVIDTVKLFQKQISIHKKGALRTVSNVEDGACVKMFNIIVL